MIEKVNPAHPDKVADRIAGAIVDLAYKAQENPKCAVEVLIGHGQCHVIIETSAPVDEEDVCRTAEKLHSALPGTQPDGKGSKKRQRKASAERESKVRDAHLASSPGVHR